MKLAFLGLGVMGYPMAGHLARAGDEVTVYNRTDSRAEAWCHEYGGARRGTPADAADGADIVFMCVGNDNDVREVAEGPRGALEGLKQGAILVDHTTASAGLARQLEQRAKARGLEFLDAPVSGGQSGALNGQLTVLVGGEEAIFRTAEPAMCRYARAVTLMGPAGSGQLTKMVNQIFLAGILQSLAEGLNFAHRAGLEAHRVAAVLSKGAAQSWQLENRASTMIDGQFDFGFAVDWMRKDLAMCLEEARSNGSSLPVAALVDQLYQQVQARGGHRWDTSSLIQLLTKP